MERRPAAAGGNDAAGGGDDAAAKGDDGNANYVGTPKNGSRIQPAPAASPAAASTASPAPSPAPSPARSAFAAISFRPEAGPYTASPSAVVLSLKPLE